MVQKPTRKTRVVSQPAPSQMGDWSRVIARQGQEYQEREEARVKHARQAADDLMSSAPTLSDADLLTHLVNTSSMSDHNPRVLEITQELRDALHAEVFRRLSSKG